MHQYQTFFCYKQRKNTPRGGEKHIFYFTNTVGGELLLRYFLLGQGVGTILAKFTSIQTNSGKKTHHVVAILRKLAQFGIQF